MSISNANSLTLHIVIATVPRKEEITYPDIVKENFYSQYIKDTTNNYKETGDYYTKPDTEIDETKKTNVLYNPLEYYIFGNYDIAFISLSDSYKFAQKLFTPKTKGNSGASNPNTFQIITGIISGGKTDDDLRAFFLERVKESNIQKTSTFIGICNLKINNGLLVGNGYNFYDKVIELIDKTINPIIKKDTQPNNNYLLLQSFSWFETSVLIFAENPGIISEALTSLRRLRLSDLKEKKAPWFNAVIENSIYYESDMDKAKIESSHIFADTHSYFGVNRREFMKKEFMKRFNGENLNIRTELEWQVKPGHLPDLIAEIQKRLGGDASQNPFNLNNPYLITGKTDYYIPEKESHDFKNTHELYMSFFQKIEGEENKIYDYVKKIKTNVQFSHTVKPNPRENDSLTFKGNTITEIPNQETPQKKLRSLLKNQLAVAPQKIEELGSHLKSLKISRQIRAKIAKIFYNFNNGIQDSILFIYFLDFSSFIQSLEEYIVKSHEEWGENFDNDTLDCLKENAVGDMEGQLIEKIKMFEEAYSIRVLNCYQFEDISDFDLDFNSSIQQLLSTYTSLASSVVNLFYSEKDSYTPLIQLNYNVTNANYYSINYNVYHLLSPEFVFFTIIKEVLNQYNRDAEEGALNSFKKLKIEFDTIIQSSTDYKFIADLSEHKQLGLDYLFIDGIRFYYIANLDFKLFSYWFWMYNFQNASMYEKTGIISESHFKKELFRLYFLAKLYNFEINYEDCPIAELQNYWDKHYFLIKIELFNLFEKHISFINSFKEEIRSNINKINSEETKVYDKNDSIDILWQKEFSINSINNNSLDTDIENSYINHFKHPRPTSSRDKEINLEYAHRYKALSYFYEHHKQNMLKGMPILYDKNKYTNTFLFTNALMYSYLKILYEQNDQKVHLLKRNWKTGEPLKSFIECDDSKFYSVDQTGGTFFYLPKELNKYFKMRNGMLQSLWHFALIQKKTQFDNLKKGFPEV